MEILASALVTRPARILRAGLDVLLDTVLPPRCAACGATVTTAHGVCGDCWRRLDFITAPLCDACGAPFEFGQGAGAHCPECQIRSPRFSSARAAMAYDGPAREVLLAFKHGDRDHLARLMAPAMARAGAAMLCDDALLVPVPLHRWRLWTRGYNQAALLAAAIARRSGNALAVDALERTGKSPSSRGMGRTARAANVRGVFRVRRPDTVRGRAVVLIDDVLTTGATAEACARILLRAGASRVDVLTWARVVRTGR
jgi:ComF family protein